jgi:hypothetical protein
MLTLSDSGILTVKTFVELSLRSRQLSTNVDIEGSWKFVRKLGHRTTLSSVNAIAQYVDNHSLAQGFDTY